jgi:type IV pilus biogenesis protein CpaD/CtpE
MRLRRLPLRTVVAITGLLLVGGGCSHRPAPPPPIPTAAEPCPQWTEFPTDRHSNRDSPYLGCSTAMNLRAMVENPADLEQGRPLGPTDGEHAASAVERYQQDKVKSGQGAGALVPSVAMPTGEAGSGQ